MSFVEEKSNKTNITRFYKIRHIHNATDALAWISDIRSTKFLTVDYMYFDNPDERSEEGASIQVEAKTEYPVMVDILNDMPAASVFLINGRYKDKPVVVGVDLRQQAVYVTIRKKEPADIEGLEGELCLIH